MPVPQPIPPYQVDPASAPVLTRPNLWLLVVAVGIGITTWAAFLYLGIRTRRRKWLAWAAVYAGLLALWLVMDGSGHPSSLEVSIGAIAALLAWLGGTAHATAVRKDTGRQTRRSGGTGLDAARERIRRREEGRRLAARDPRLAREAGVGRPDLPGADDFGLFDVNHASPQALSSLPGITPEIAQRIAETRETVGFFQSAEDLGVVLDLSPQLVDEISEFVVFL
jgi:hypothetical protein